MSNPAPAQPAVTEEASPPSRRLTGVATLVALVAVAVIAVGLAAWFRGEANQLGAPGALSNDAVVDAGATVQVSQQVSAAVQRVYSYDYSRLDADEKAANEVITGPFVQSFQQQFARIRQLAPPQQAVVVATVPAAAVKVLEGDQAVVMVFIDQQARQGGQAKPLLATGRLSVTAQRVNGDWKIANVESF